MTDSPANAVGRSSKVVLIVIVLIAVVTRATGFTHGDLWFDDAWAALPARVGIGSAVHMAASTPLYTLFMRSWIALFPNLTWWSQLPAFILGVASIIAIYRLTIYFEIRRGIAQLVALALAVSPVAVDYSTRVKQYNGDILLACLLLWLFEAWRREANTVTSRRLLLAGAVAPLISATTIVVTLPIMGVVGILAFYDKARRRSSAVIIIGALGVFALEYAVWLSHLSSSLFRGWTNRGFMLRTDVFHWFCFSLQVMFSSFFHYLLALPTGHPPDPDKNITSMGTFMALVGVVTLAVLLVPSIWESVRTRGRSVRPLLVPAVILVTSVLLAFVGVSPFGGGRTDEVVYPAVLILLAGLFGRIRQRLVDRVGPRALIAITIILTSCLLWSGVENHARYPVLNLRSVVAEMRSSVRPGDVIVVDPWATFTWALDDLSPTKVSFENAMFPWSQGFHVVSLDPRVVISQEYYFGDSTWSNLFALGTKFRRIWYVGVTISPDGFQRPGHSDDLIHTRNYNFLTTWGWKPSGLYFTAPNTEALLLTVPGLDLHR